MKLNNGVTARRMLPRVVGMVLLLALVVSWFIWGPLGPICYVCGLFDLVMAFAFMPLLFGLLLLGVVALLSVEVIRVIVRWRKLPAPDRRIHCCFIAIMAAFVISFGLGFTGIQPVPIEMFSRGFARYMARGADVPAIRAWLSTLDPKDYADVETDPGGVPIPEAEQPPIVARFHTERFPHGVRIVLSNAGRLMVRLTWGGGFIGHWGIEVGDTSMGTPPDSEFIAYRPLAPGAWVWYESN
jgi:hypothetical protein